jgi:threonine dehydrogenase-like Zn-dependent dehydrogenase
MEKIRDLTLLSDIFPTGYHGAVNAGVVPGSTVYVAGAGPVGLACAATCQLLGASIVIVGDSNQLRLDQAKAFGCKTINVRDSDDIQKQIHAIVGVSEVDAAIDCVGFEAQRCVRRKEEDATRARRPNPQDRRQRYDQHLLLVLHALGIDMEALPCHSTINVNG